VLDAGKAPREEDIDNAMKRLESRDKEKFMTLIEYFKPKIFKRGMEKGLEQGLEQGRKERDIQMAKTLLLEGIDMDIISKTTGLSKEEIRKFYS